MIFNHSVQYFFATLVYHTTMLGFYGSAAAASKDENLEFVVAA